MQSQSRTSQVPDFLYRDPSAGLYVDSNRESRGVAFEKVE